MRELSKNDHERIEKVATERLTPGQPDFFTFIEGACYEHIISHEQTVDQVLRHITDMRNVISFWDDEEGDNLKYVESLIGLLNQLIKEIENLKKL